MKAIKLSLAVLIMTLMTALPVCAQDASKKGTSQPADESPLTLPKMITVLVGALAGGTLLYGIGEQLFVETVADTTVGVAQTVVASDMAEHSGIVTAMTIFGGTMGGIFSGIGYDRYSDDVRQGVDGMIRAAKDALAAAADLIPWNK